ncbi:MAG: helix-turn-helix domain-containing protein [Luteolibacter sp.]|uniref:helix-turn-helix domain-containing protein n=1 Tax=Luteolibacter sp. TaxID=1962973 RepID=UPI0032630728
MQDKAIAIMTVLDRVAAVSGIPVKMLIGRKRTQRVVHARWLVIWVLHRENPTWTLEDLANAIGAKQHGTAHHALRSVPDLAEADGHFRAMVRDLETRVTNGLALSPDLVAEILAAADIAARPTTRVWLLAAADSLQQAAGRIRTELATA